jgi:hypothetical protein
MPRLDNPDEMETNQAGTGTFTFTATTLDNLGASEYTLVGIAADASSSVAGFVAELNEAIASIIGSCQHSPRADNLLIRLSQFSSDLEEIHGFKMLSSCHLSDYGDVLKVGGATALNDAVVDMCSAVSKQGDNLTSNDYEVNGILFVVTDGMEYRSTMGIESAIKAMKDVMRSESLESFLTVLIGVNIEEDYVRQQLDEYQSKLGFDKFIPVKDASPKTLAKLAEFVSKSISSQSQALGSGGPSQAIPNSLTI